MSRKPVDVIFGCGVFNQSIAKEFVNSAVILVTTQGTRRRFLDDYLRLNNISPKVIVDDCIENPTFNQCDKLYKEIDHTVNDKIIAVGGGSVIDTAKVLAMYKNDTKADFSAVKKTIMTGQGYDNFIYLPIVAAPTTAGTGSDVTPWGTVWDNQGLEKFSVSNPALYPVKSYCDPELTLSLPLDVTVATALDALSHAFESVWNSAASDESYEYAERCIELVLEYLYPLSQDLKNTFLREKIMEAALYGGYALAMTKSSVAHALSYYLTLRKGTVHGLACSFTLPHILKVYLEDHDNTFLTDSHLSRLKELFSLLGISVSPLSYGIGAEEFDDFFDSEANSERFITCSVNINRLREELRSAL